MLSLSENREMNHCRFPPQVQEPDKKLLSMEKREEAVNVFRTRIFLPIFMSNRRRSGQVNVKEPFFP